MENLLWEEPVIDVYEASPMAWASNVVACDRGACC